MVDFLVKYGNDQTSIHVDDNSKIRDIIKEARRSMTLPQTQDITYVEGVLTEKQYQINDNSPGPEDYILRVHAR